jgi:hypothetical protein
MQTNNELFKHVCPEANGASEGKGNNWITADYTPNPGTLQATISSLPLLSVIEVLDRLAAIGSRLRGMDLPCVNDTFGKLHPGGEL